MTLATLCYSLSITLAALFDGIPDTQPPVAQGGKLRRKNQATLEKSGR